MNKITHIFFAVFIYIIWLQLNQASFNLIGFIILLISSLIPDIDLITSTFGKKIKIIAFAFKHRGFFHSLLFGILIILILFSLNFYYFEFTIGYFSHLLLDMLTKKGVCFFWPLDYRIKGFLQTGDVVEKIICLSLLILIILFLI